MTTKNNTIDIDPSLLVPSRVSSGEIELAQYTIYPCGLSSDTVGDVIIDRRFALIQPHPDSLLYICPLRPNAQPTTAEAWFYNDCIAYEHEIPAIVAPTKEELSDFKYRYIHSGPSEPRESIIKTLESNATHKKIIRHPIPPESLTHNFLINQLLSILEETRELRHGPMTFVLFRTHRYHRRVHLDYSSLYGAVSKEISLYSAALRQADFLSEYLGYYRVIESVTVSNGKKWIIDALNRLKSHRFGRILLGHENDYNYCPVNIFREYRKRANARLRELRKTMRNEEIAKYFYNVNRCGIAHGKNSVVKADIVPSYFDIARDSVILKLLARMAIDEKRA